MNNQDIISRSALMLHIAGTKIHLKGDGDWISGYRDALQAIGELVQTTPAVDAVEVVRCAECIYWQDNNGGYPHEDCRWGKGETPDADDFCSYGERKGDDA